MSGLGSFVRSTRLAWLLGLLLGGLAFAAHAAHDVALGHRSWVSGWLLVGAMVFLTLYNLRKKLDFLPAFASSRHWLWAHLLVGYLSVWLFVLHVGVRLPSGVLEGILWAQFVVVIASGVFGHFISRRFPRLLADRGQEALFERIPTLIHRQRLRVEEAVLRAAREGESTAIPDLYRDRLLDFFSGPRHGWEHLLGSRRPLEGLLRALESLEKLSARGEQDVIDDLRAAVTAKDDLDFQHAHQALLKSWLFVHVPLAYSLCVVMVLHVVVAYAFGGIQ